MQVLRPTIGMNVMTQEEKEQLHAATMEILEEVGVEVYDEEALALLKNGGASVDGINAKIPASMVEEALKSSPGLVTIYDREGNPKMDLTRGNIYFGTGSDTPLVLDWETRQQRKAVLNDTAQASIVADALPNIDFVMSMGLASDAPVRISDIHQVKAMLLNTIKPFIFTAHNEHTMDVMIQICEMAKGSTIMEKPNMILYAEPISPLRHPMESMQKLLLAAKKGVPVAYVPACLIGGGAPITLAGSLVVVNSELLSALVIHQLKRPGSPFIYGGATPAMDMRTGSCTYAAPEIFLNYACLADMARYYDLPVFDAAGCSEANDYDQQAGIEMGYTLLSAALSGGNLIHDVGFLGCGMIASIEAMVAGNEAIGAIKHMIRGVNFRKEKFAVDEIKHVGIGGTYLNTEHTAENFREEIWIPELFNRESYYTWDGGGRISFRDKLKAKISGIISQNKVSRLPKDLEDKIEQTVNNA
ncbi:trimethylamine:corrinoid methyltransferase [Desulfosporosinus orientis DSM 765]|uniref:Trimethylamine:corrinoid methyltransferase n=1 Tax=Desulfosporosinus orientis (strain ATCC 19365 / DSM 765 / NCIMB 8382 / VKM B-1628 / Singapore I) TaxID=768706 RepID=G7W6X7_DESOD|nr:trimethylamine--corrinoid methyltransferase [Desulfosporosinus orientis]AET69834.1 trimethylamine:corrinoid methyltransferase [Desulfosporosinus orientis DSM 765]